MPRRHGFLFIGPQIAAMLGPLMGLNRGTYTSWGTAGPQATVVPRDLGEPWPESQTLCPDSSNKHLTMQVTSSEGDFYRCGKHEFYIRTCGYPLRGKSNDRCTARVVKAKGEKVFVCEACEKHVMQKCGNSECPIFLAVPYLEDFSADRPPVYCGEHLR